MSRETPRTVEASADKLLARFRLAHEAGDPLAAGFAVARCKALKCALPDWVHDALVQPQPMPRGIGRHANAKTKLLEQYVHFRRAWWILERQHNVEMARQQAIKNGEEPEKRLSRERALELASERFDDERAGDVETMRRSFRIATELAKDPAVVRRLALYVPAHVIEQLSRLQKSR